MSTMEPGRQLMTLINVFKADPERQQELVSLPTEATEKTMPRRKGAAALAQFDPIVCEIIESIDRG